MPHARVTGLIVLACALSQPLSACGTVPTYLWASCASPQYADARYDHRVAAYTSLPLSAAAHLAVSRHEQFVVVCIDGRRLPRQENQFPRAVEVLLVAGRVTDAYANH
jgi:hypothetical protein